MTFARCAFLIVVTAALSSCGENPNSEEVIDRENEQYQTKLDLKDSARMLAEARERIQSLELKIQDMDTTAGRVDEKLRDVLDASSYHSGNIAKSYSDTLKALGPLTEEFHDLKLKIRSAWESR